MTKKAYFEQMTRRDFVNSKLFWNTVKPFLTNKDFSHKRKYSYIKQRKTH